MTEPMTCLAAELLIVRYADDPAALGAADRDRLEQHLGECEACGAVLADQRQVAQLLHERPQATLSRDFAARLSARIDADAGWLALANWRWWTVTLTPLAAALVFVAWVAGAATPQAPVIVDPFEAWGVSSSTGDSAAVFLQSSTGDMLLEAVLTGSAPSAGEADVR